MTLPQEFKGYAKVISEGKVFEHVYDIIDSIFVFFSQGIENFNFNHGLMVESGI